MSIRLPMLYKPAACVLSPARSPARSLSLTRMHACLIELRFMHAWRAFAAEGRNGHGRGVCRLPQRAVGAARWRGEGTWRQVCARDAAAHRAHAIAHGAVSMLMARVSRVVLRMRWFARARSCVRACVQQARSCLWLGERECLGHDVVFSGGIGSGTSTSTRGRSGGECPSA